MELVMEIAKDGTVRGLVNYPTVRKGSLMFAQNLCVHALLARLHVINTGNKARH